MSPALTVAVPPPVGSETDDPPEPVPLCKSPRWTGAKKAGFIDALAGDLADTERWADEADIEDDERGQGILARSVAL